MLIDPSGNPSIPFTLYALEQEGEIDTPVGKRNKVIKNLRQRACWQLLDENIVREEAAAAGIYDYSEIEYIKSQVGV
jgi:hypothetical protein